MNHDLKSVIPLYYSIEKWGANLDVPLHTIIALEDVVQERNTFEIR